MTRRLRAALEQIVVVSEKPYSRSDVPKWAEMADIARAALAEPRG